MNESGPHSGSLVLPHGAARLGEARPGEARPGEARQSPATLDKPEVKVWPELDLPAPLTLKFLRGQEVLFTSEGHWLHPLFDLEAYLAKSGEVPAGTLLVDRVTGRAAACLMARLGLPRLRTGVLSRLAIPILEAHDIACLAREIVDRIPCATEDELAGVEDLEVAYDLLRERRHRTVKNI